MRLRPYRKDTDFAYIQSWIDSKRTHALWSGDRIPYPLTFEGLQNRLEQNEKEMGDSAYTFTDDAGTPVGFLSYSINEKENSGFIRFVVVNSKERGKGYGTQMIKRLLQYAFTITNVDYVQINVFDCNSQARKCYEKAGFREVDFLPEIFPFEEENWGRYIMRADKE